MNQKASCRVVEEAEKAGGLRQSHGFGSGLIKGEYRLRRWRRGKAARSGGMSIAEELLITRLVPPGSRSTIPAISPGGVALVTSTGSRVAGFPMTERKYSAVQERLRIRPRQGSAVDRRCIGLMR